LKLPEVLSQNSPRNCRRRFFPAAFADRAERFALGAGLGLIMGCQARPPRLALHQHSNALLISVLLSSVPAPARRHDGDPVAAESVKVKRSARADRHLNARGTNFRCTWKTHLAIRTVPNVKTCLLHHSEAALRSEAKKIIAQTPTAASALTIVSGG
jgi:hypothetical protein